MIRKINFVECDQSIGDLHYDTLHRIVIFVSVIIDPILMSSYQSVNDMLPSLLDLLDGMEDINLTPETKLLTKDMTSNI